MGLLDFILLSAGDYVITNDTDCMLIATDLDEYNVCSHDIRVNVNNSRTL